MAASWLRLAFVSVLPFLAAYFLYRFYVDGLVWAGPLGFLCLTLALFCSQLRSMVDGAQVKRVLMLLYWALLVSSVVAIAIAFAQQR